jgi:hypothetical protein
LFNQGATTLSDRTIDRVKIVGFDLTDSTNIGADVITKLEELQTEDNDWFIFLTDIGDDAATHLTLAEWAEHSEPTETELDSGKEDRRKWYFFWSASKTAFTHKRRTVHIYTPEAEECADAAYVGNVAPFWPQSVTWKFKKPHGMAVHPLTELERDTFLENNVNFYTREYKHEYIKEGVCADGEYIDVQMGADWIAINMRDEIYDCLTTNPKIPYTDQGFALIGSCVLNVLTRATQLGIIASESGGARGIYTVNIPLRKNATDEQARARRMPDVTWEAQLEGAVHLVKVKGTLRATLDTLPA